MLAAALEDPENITSVLASLPRPPWKKDNPRVERRQTRGRKAEGSTAAERENAAVGSTSNDADDSKFVPPPLLRNISQESKEIANSLTMPQYIATFSRKMELKDKLRHREINSRAYRKESNQVGREFNNYYGDRLGGIRDRLEKYGRLVPIKSAELEEERESIAFRNSADGPPFRL